MKRLIALLLLLAVGLGGAWAAAPAEPLDLVRDTSDRMIGALRENRDELNQYPSRIYDLVDEIVLPHFDFRAMAQWVLGKHWRQASAEQRERFTAEFRNLLVRSYAGVLLEYSNEEVRFPPSPVAGKDADEVTVRSEIVPKSGPAIPIHYSMHKVKDGSWKVYDVIIDGISQVITYRGSFADQIRRDGMDGLISSLAKRNAEDKL